MAARKTLNRSLIEQTDKMVPIITSESVLGPYVSKLVSGVEVFDIDLWVKIDPVKQAIQSNSVRSRYVSRRRTSAFDNHLDDRFIVFKNVNQRMVANKVLRFE